MSAAGAPSWNIYLKSASGVMRCPVSFQQPIPPSSSWNVDVDESSWPASHFRHKELILAAVRRSVGLLRCVFAGLEQSCAALSKPSFLFKWYVLFTSPYHEVVKHSWNASLALEIISWARWLREPHFCSLLFTWKCCIFTQGVSPFMGVFCQSLKALH